MTTQTNDQDVYSVGDMVEWTSSSNSSTTLKAGRVEAVIAAERPLSLQQRRDTDASGSPRNHTSYLVYVPSKSGRGKGKLYWPRVNQLGKSAKKA